jgi:hypothetical protein
MSDDKVGFVSEPNRGRGTMGIIWSCLATITLCTYSALHLNIPKKASIWYRFKRTIGYTLVGILAPEYICAMATVNLIQSHKIRRVVRKRDITLTSYQAQFLMMKGIVIYQAKKGGGDVNKTVVNEDNCISAMMLPEVRARLPSDEEIDARSKSDFLTKGLTMIQILWFTSQVITRHFQGKDVSLLEVSTLAYICLAIFTYGCWLNKPQGVSLACVVEIDSNVDLSTIQKDQSYMPSKWHQLALFSLIFGLFSGIHCFAWNYSFPSVPEQWGFRMCSIIVFITGYAALYFFGEEDLDELWKGVGGLVSIVLYIFARMFLIVEAFLAFRSAPASIYASVDWSMYFPMLG